MALTVENLACSRGGIAVLDGVSLAVADGAALILRGPNGIGKTTLLRTLAGLQKPDAGRIEIAEDAVAYGGHADGLKAMLSVAENLSFWAGIYGGGEIAAALHAFGLVELAGRQARDLSAGQKRRLGLARLLVTGRAVWLLDEPTVSLDRDATAMFERAVAAHLAGGGVAVIATHVPLAIAAEEMDLTPFRATARAAAPAFDEAFT